MLENKKNVLFDMDGVISHTNPHHVKAFEAFFDKYNVPYTNEEFEEHMLYIIHLIGTNPDMIIN